MNRIIKMFVDWSNRQWFFICIGAVLILGFIFGMIIFATAINVVSWSWVLSNFWFWNTVLCSGGALVLVMYEKWEVIKPSVRS